MVNQSYSPPKFLVELTREDLRFWLAFIKLAKNNTNSQKIFDQTISWEKELENLLGTEE